MAQPPDQNFYHHPLSQSHPRSHAHPPTQLQLTPQFRNPFDLIFDERTGYNYIRPYLSNQMPKPEELSESLVMRRPRRTRTTFTSSQIAELEQHFLQGRYLTPPRLSDLSSKLGLGTAQIKIWFKNRRRRHKIQSDQHRDQNYDCAPLSPSMPAGLKADSDPPSMQSLNLNSTNSGVVTPNVLTPSSMGSTPTAHPVDHFGESFNSYYAYNGQHAVPHSHSVIRRHPNGHSQYTTVAPNGATQFYAAQQQPQQQQLHPQSVQSLHPQQRSQHQLHERHITHPPQLQQQEYHNFDFHEKSSSTSTCRSVFHKEDHDADYNFNSSYYMRLATTAPTALPNVSSTGMAIDVTSALSPGSEVYEPLTPKNDDSPSLCNGVGSSGGVGSVCSTADVGAVDASVDLDDGPNKTTTIQNLEPLKRNRVAADKHCDSDSSFLGAGLRSVSAASRLELSSNCNSLHNKICKLPVALPPHPTSTSHESIIHETNPFHCTMDTIMQAYNSHRSTAGNSQFAYCYN